MKYATLETSPLAGLEPELFWKHFYELTRVPRESKNEKAAGDYVISVAERLNLSHRRDDAGNVVISKAGSPGHENAPGVVLQSHLDMVCEKVKGSTFDFSRDPIELRKEGDLIGAAGTSLGADNSAGIAASLAVLESKGLVHPPIECLFTTDEETGMTGAKGLKGDFLKGRRLLNLDSEEEGDIYVGCSGGSDNQLCLPVMKAAAPASGIGVKVKLTGLKGGHSGLNIHEGRANAIKLLGRFLWNTLEDLHLHLASLSGGSKRNVIPPDAEALLVIEPGDVQELERHAAIWEKTFACEFTPLEEHIAVKIEKADKPAQVYTPETSEKLLSVIMALPHGVLAMSRALKDLVETSTNMAIVREQGSALLFELSHRSSSASSLRSVDQGTAAFAKLCGLGYYKGEGYPGWQPNMESEVLKTARKTYKELFGKDAHIKAIHAGLECGLIGEKFPGMDMISFGPTLANVHSTAEVINAPSVKLFWKFLVQLLNALA